MTDLFWSVLRLSIPSQSEPSAYFLIAHGSRDPRSRLALEACVLMVRQELVNRREGTNLWPQVGSGVLEFGDRPLSEQIQAFAEGARRDGIHRVFLMPLFLMLGNHVQQDLPAAVEQAQAQLSIKMNLVLCPPLGSHPHLEHLVLERMAEQHCDQWILMAHGTRRPDGNATVAALADRVGALPTYWSTEPSLETQLQAIPETAQVGIMPYFLFTGSITDAIRDKANQLQSQFPHLNLHMMPPLNPSPLLAQLLLDQCPLGLAVQ